MEGHHLNRYMLTLGGRVIVVPAIYSNGGSPPYPPTLEEHRPVDGCKTLESVAGMLELNEVSEVGALNEVQEELGPTIQENKLRLLHSE